MSESLDCQMGRLLDILTTDPDQPTDVGAAIAAAPPVGTLPPPQVTWAWLGFVRYLRHKAWARKQVKESIQPVTSRHWRGRDGHGRRYEYTGPLPRHPKWDCHLLGQHGQLIHSQTGARIALWMGEGWGKVLPDKELPAYYAAGDPDDVVAQRVVELFPYRFSWAYSLSLLAEAGPMRRSFDAYELSAAGEKTRPLVSRVFRACSIPGERLRLAVRIGDWPWALSLAQSECPDVVGEIAPRAEKCERLWLDHLHGPGSAFFPRWNWLHALAAARAPDLNDYIADALADDLMGGHAVDLIRDDPSWCPRMLRTLRLWARYPNCDEEPRAIAEYLDRHNYRIADTIKVLCKKGDRACNALIWLALRHDPELLTSVLPAALCCHDPEDVETAAAVLLLLDSEWSRQVLFDVESAGEISCWEPELLAALYECRDAETRQRLREWEAINDADGQEPDELPEIDEARWEIRKLMTEFRDAVDAARERLPGGGRGGKKS